MARPKLVPAASSEPIATTERLLVAAEEEFARLGFEGARLSDIAARVGISRPSLLYHYESKQALYTAVVRTAFLRLGAALAFELDGRDPFDQRLGRAVDGFVEFVEERPSLAKLLIREMLDDRGPGHEIVVSAGVPVLEQIEAFLRTHGAERVRAGLPLREALLQIVCAVLMRTSAGSLRAPLWGERDDTRAVALAMLLAPGLLPAPTPGLDTDARAARERSL